MRIEFLSERESSIIVGQLGGNLSNESRVSIVVSELMVSAAFSSRDIIIKGDIRSRHVLLLRQWNFVLDTCLIKKARNA